MKMHRKPILCACLFFAANILFAFLTAGLKIGQTVSMKYIVYSVRFDYYGVDGEVIERQITVPLEERISGMEGLMELTSAAEYGSSTTTAYFDRGVNTKQTYLALRDGVDTLYRTLPSSVQKPRIYSSTAQQKSVFTVAAFSTQLDVDALRSLMEKGLKKHLEGLNGVAEVIVAGGHMQEIKVEFDGGRLASGDLNPEALSSVIRNGNVVAPSAALKTGRGDKTLSFNTRLTSLQEMGDLPVVISAGQVMPLSRLARVRKGQREQEEIVKINGRESVVVHVKAASEGNAVAIGKECRRALAAYSDQGDVTFQVLADEGAFLFGLIKSLGVAILQSFVLVLLIIPLFFASRRVLVCVVALLPVSIFWTFALLRTTGFSLDQNGLAGISIALGLIVDSALVCAELAGKAESRAAFLRGQRSLVPSIIASTLTTMLALVPLYFLESIVPGIRSTACTIAFMLLASLAVCLVFLPAFLWSDSTASANPGYSRLKGLTRRCTRTLLRLLHRLISWGTKKAKVCTIIYGLLAVLPVVLFLLCGKDISMEVRDAVLPVYVEFDGEIAPDAVDRDCTRLQGGIRAIPGVTFVSAEARKGNLEMTLGYDAKRLSRRDIARRVQRLAALTTGFLYVPDGEDAAQPKARQNGRPVSVEIAVVGDEAEVCRETAREAAAKVGALPECAQVVLNFKPPEEMYRFVPDRYRSARAGVTTAVIAETLRWVLFGPVADKWVQDGAEMDIRVKGGNANTLKDVNEIYVPGAKGAVRLATLGKLERGAAQGRIYRKDGRRAAYITATMMSTSMDKTIRALRAALAMVPLEANYGFSLSRELENMSSHYRTLILAFALCVALILLLLTALNERPLQALAITALIPVSAALPLIICVITRRPLTMGDVTGMVVLGGIAVNNGIYIAESPKGTIRARVRDKIRSLAAASLTTIAGCLPLLLFNGSDFSRSLAFFMLWGTLGSVLASLALFPGVLNYLAINTAMLRAGRT